MEKEEMAEPRDPRPPLKTDTPHHTKYHADKWKDGQDEAQQPSWWAIVKEGLRGDWDDYRHSLSTFHKEPCFRQSMLWAIGLSFLVAVHRFKETGLILRATDWWVGSFFVIGTGGWVLCRKSELSKVASLQEFYRDKGTGKFDETLEGMKEDFHTKHGTPAPTASEKSSEDTVAAVAAESETDAAADKQALEALAEQAYLEAAAMAPEEKEEPSAVDRAVSRGSNPSARQDTSPSDEEGATAEENAGDQDDGMEWVEVEEEVEDVKSGSKNRAIEAFFRREAAKLEEKRRRERQQRSSEVER